MTALIRLLSSTPFRLTLAYMGAFVLAAALIVGFIAWRANELLTTKVVETLTAEVTGLREQFQAGGAERLARRSSPSAPPSPAPASICWSTPPAARSPAISTACRRSSTAPASGGVFSYVRAAEDGAGALARSPSACRCRCPAA